MVARIIFSLYAWNAGPVDVTDVDISVVDIIREFQFLIDLSTDILMEGTSEGHPALYKFEAASPPMFRHIELFKILLS